MGNVYDMLDDYVHALEYYKECYRMKSKFLPDHHPQIALTLRNIARIYEKKEELANAEEFYRRASDQK